MIAQACRDARKGSSSFLKKISKKLIGPGTRAAETARDSNTKVFCLFFSKKKRLPFSLAGSRKML
jgi:hypothetical protein